MVLASGATFLRPFFDHFSSMHPGAAANGPRTIFRPFFGACPGGTPGTIFRVFLTFFAISVSIGAFRILILEPVIEITYGKWCL